MADDAKQLQDDLKELERLASKLGKSVNLGNLKNDADAVKELLKAWRKELDEINSEFKDLSSIFKNVINDLKNFDDTSSRINRSFKILGSLTDKLKYDSDGISKLNKRDLESLQKKARVEVSNLKVRKEELDLSVKRRFQNLSDEQISSIGARTKDKNLAKEISQYIELQGIFDKNGNLKDEEGNYVKKLLDLTQKRIEKEKEITRAIGVTGNALKGLSKIPGIGNMLKTEEAIQDMKDLAWEMKNNGKDINSFSNKLKIAGVGLKTAFGGVKESLTDPISIVTFIITQSLKANTQIVALGKALGSSSETYRENLVDISRTTNNLNVTTGNLAEAFNEIVKATGFAYNFSVDQLVTQIKLTKQVGLQVDEAAQVQRYSVLTGKTSEETYRSFLKGIVATRNQLKVGIDFKSTLAEVAKVSGQIAANLGFNPERIAKAVVTAKALGLTFEQLKSATSSLLNFSTSLESELDAELLTGKQLNLERARAAALAGDQVTLAEELAKNVGTVADFTRLNVLQQDALSKAVGMTSDQLAETLRKREEAVKSGKSLAQVTEEEAAKALERQSIQDKFQAAVLKLQDLLGNIVAGPLAGFLDVLSGALNVVNLLGNALSFLAGPLKIIAGLWLTIKGIQLASLASTKAMTIYEGMKRAYVGTQVSMATGYNAALLIRKSLLAGELAKTIAIAAAWAVANPLTALVGLGVAAAVSAGLYSMLKGDDIMSEGGYGKRTLLSPEGAIKLNDKDTIIAGTDLGGGQNNISGPSVDLTPMIAAINEVRSAVNNLVNRPIYLSIDGKNIGTALVQGSHKVA